MPNRKARSIALAAALVALVFTLAPAPYIRASSTFLYPVTPPIKVYYDTDGKPLNGGYIYFGTANQNPETNPVQMYWDAAGTIPAPQPLRTVGGFISRQGSPANVYATGDLSVTIKNSKGQLVATSPTSVDLQLALAITGAGTAAAIPLADAGGYYTTDNVEAALQQVAGPGFVDQTRLAAAVQALLVPTGAVFDFVGTTAPTGYVLGGLGTIGDASSGASRANADTSALYTLLWNAYSNTELVIQDSAGTPTTRGASAANDYAAHKRLPTPDCRGRVRAGKDNMGPVTTTAGRLTNAGAGIVGTTMGAAGGSETHALTTGELATHNHGVTDPGHSHTKTDTGHAHTGTVSSHSHVYDKPTTHSGAATVAAGSTYDALLFAYSATDSATTIPTVTINSATTGISYASATTGLTVNNTGSGTAHTVTQPTIVFNVIIKL